MHGCCVQTKLQNRKLRENAALACKFILIFEYIYLRREKSCQKLQLAVARVAYDVAHFTVDADVVRTVKLLGAADGANMRAVGVLKDLDAIVFTISNNYLIPRFVERKSYRMLQIAASCANADAAQINTTAAQHLDAIAVAVAHDNIPIFVIRDVAFSRKLAVAVAISSEGGNQFSIKLINLYFSVAELDSNIAAAPVNCDASWIDKNFG